jgi:hypothetical protein
MTTFKDLFEGDVIGVNFARKKLTQGNPDHKAHSVRNDGNDYHVLDSAPAVRKPNGGPVLLQHAQGSTHVAIDKGDDGYMIYKKGAPGGKHVLGFQVGRVDRDRVKF